MKQIQLQLKKLKKETADISKQRVHYKLQSEWHRLMYSRTLEIELLEKLLTPPTTVQ